MDFQFQKIIKKMKNEERGSFTLEASLVFPTIFIVTIALILFSLTIYDKVVLYQRAYVIAERVAFSWDNSHKDFETGYFAATDYTTMEDGDGLYWRTNAIGTDLIRAIGLNTSSVTDQKIHYSTAASGGMVPAGDITITPPSGAGFNRKVKVTIDSQISVPPFVDMLTESDVSVTASASVKDPVELIRTTDLIYYYGEQVVNFLTN